MVADVDAVFELDDLFVRDLAGLYEPWSATEPSDPRLVVLNDALASELGVDPKRLRTPEGVGMLSGAVVPEGARPVAQAYAGHQFGGFSPRLGDGRALLMGEIIDAHGHRRDLHLKGSGRTPYARGGDGLAALGPMLREYVMCEAMHALAVPTTRGLAVVATGDQVTRDTKLPGAVFARVASSHLRVGTFQYAATHEDPTLVLRLTDHAIARHHPDLVAGDDRYVAFFDAVMDAQASLVAQWMHVGFIHGVMNTDNMTISGESIDYGPCAFMESYDSATVFSSIDHGGRYAYGNQPQIAQWNLARLAEPLLPLFDLDAEAAVEIATERLQAFPEIYRRHWRRGMHSKLGVTVDVELGADGSNVDDGDPVLADDVLALLEADGVDFTTFFRNLSSAVRGDADAVRSLFTDPAGYDEWAQRWTAAVANDQRTSDEVADAMDAVNPAYIPRNHLVEEALAAAVEGDLGPFEQLMAVLARPFTVRTGLDRYREPAPVDFTATYRTFCGT